jgi:hypothetical protein
MIIGAPDVERVGAFEAEHDPILIVHAHSVEPSPVTAERVQPVAGRDSHIIEPRYRVELIQFAAHDRPEIARNAPVPDVPRGVIRQRPDHRRAL